MRLHQCDCVLSAGLPLSPRASAKRCLDRHVSSAEERDRTSPRECKERRLDRDRHCRLTRARALHATMRAIGYKPSHYALGSQPTHPHPQLPGRAMRAARLTGDATKPAVEYLELGGSEAPEYAFKALPCPKCSATMLLGPNTT
jgi:hypothetical protein